MNTFFSVSIVFAPLIGFIISLIGHNKKQFSQVISCLSVGLSFLFFIALWLRLGSTTLYYQVDLLPWLEIGSLNVKWGLLFDSLSCVMCGIVTLISFLVHLYSLGYMAHDESRGRFMAYLNLFTFMMLLLITSPNMVQLFVGWEGVGLASYLLIGFWYEKPSANTAAMKAFIVNRVGDAGLVLGMCTLFMHFGSLDFSILTQNPAQYNPVIVDLLGFKIHMLNLAGILLFIGAMGKSAQFGLHTWLPDAMEGPTPVSALIHAATMVTAGIFLIVRLSPLFDYAPLAREIMVWVGALTALFAATVALTQNDIKRIIAYSTCSQLGYMILACGCSAYAIAIFHLVTHAFFKALLFLGAGSTIHAMSDEQNIQKMGGIYRFIPITYAMMWIGNLALAGIPYFSGFYSKDAIIASIFSSSHFPAYVISLIVVFLTAFYSWRLLFIAFHGKCHANEHVVAHIHESSFSMLAPLFVLSIGAIFSGWIGWQWFIEQEGFQWNKALITSPFNHHIYPSVWLEHAPLILAVLGIFCAYLIYIRLCYQVNSSSQRGIYKFFYHKWYIDELYKKVWINSALKLGNLLWKKGDVGTIDQYGSNAVSRSLLFLSHKNRTLQSGYIFHYALIIIVSICLFVSFYYALFYKDYFTSLISNLIGNKWKYLF